MALKLPFSHGLEDYNSTDAAQTINNGSHTTVTNNGLGGNTNVEFMIPNRSPIWDTVTNRFDFAAAGLDLGDTVEIRFDMNIITAGANREIKYGLTLGEGGSAYDLTAGHDLFKSAGTYNKVTWTSIYMGDENTLNNPASIWIESDSGSDQLDYNGHFVKVSLQRPVYV